MKEEYVDEFDLNRIIASIEHEMEVKPLEEPEVVVTDKNTEGDEGHVVNLDRMDCSCDDYEYNCQTKEKELGDKKFCKHLFRIVFEKHRML